MKGSVCKTGTLLGETNKMRLLETQPVDSKTRSVSLYGTCVNFVVYLLYYVCIAVFTLDAGLLAISQYSEGPATGHLGTGFSWFPCV